MAVVAPATPTTIAKITVTFGGRSVTFASTGTNRLDVISFSDGSKFQVGSGTINGTGFVDAIFLTAAATVNGGFQRQQGERQSGTRHDDGGPAGGRNRSAHEIPQHPDG